MTSKRRSNASANDRKRSRAEDENGDANRSIITRPKKGTSFKSKIRNSASSWNYVTKSQQMTGYGVVVVVIAIAMGMIWNAKMVHKNVDPSISAFWKSVCRSSWCGRMVYPTKRTLQAVRPIRPGETLVEIPRTHQIWELDALRTDIVKELLPARHQLTQNPLAGGAYLAAHVALEQQRLTISSNVTGPSLSSIDKVRALYFRSLPSYKDLKEMDHPILMSRSDLRTMLGHHSWNFAVVIMYQEMVESEYVALTNTSATFGSLVTKEDYQTARIHVLTRSFNPGPEGCLGEQERLFKEEREEMETLWGLEKDTLFAEGCHSMVPILDMLNHHPQPNVVYKFDTGKQAFVISAKSQIPVKWELMDSYGMYSDSHLFAKFGFVNGDGSFP
jgi:hypothetical protein